MPAVMSVLLSKKLLISGCGDQDKGRIIIPGVLVRYLDRLFRANKAVAIY
jgi:hypothetical protein